MFKSQQLSGIPQEKAKIFFLITADLMHQQLKYNIEIFLLISKIYMKKIKLNQENAKDQSIDPSKFFATYDLNASARQVITNKSLKSQIKKANRPSRQKTPFIQNKILKKYQISQQSLVGQDGTDRIFENMTSQSSKSSKSASDYDKQINNIASAMFKCSLAKKRKRRPLGLQLKNIVERQKINNLVSNFIVKLKRNNIFSNQVEDDVLQMNQNQEEKWFQYDGIQLNQYFQKCFEVLIVVTNFFFIYYYSILMTYTQFITIPMVIEAIGLIIFLTDLILNMIKTKVVAGKKITSIREIVYNYMFGFMLVDLLLIVVIVANMCVHQQQLSYFKLIILAKLPYSLESLQKLEIYFVSTNYKEQYWSLIKVFLFNFCYAHVLALLLTSMAKITPESNWMTHKDINYNNWYQVYIWAYYWAVNIMLTVGFGDIVATTYQEALCLIFFQTISCIVLAYNVSCVGSLISNIRAQDQEKSKNFKVFYSLTQKQDISPELQMKISNYIQESNNVKKKFNIQQQNNFINSLPKIYKKDYLKQSNKSIFQNIYFFRNLADRAIQSLAQSIQINIAHPEEVILSAENYLSLKILREGRVGFSWKKGGSDFNGKIIEQISIKQGQTPLLIGLQFILLKKPIYQIKSLEYSVNYSLSYEKLISSLKKSRGDYEYYFFLRDKSKYIVDQFQIVKCPRCSTNHTKFNCPKLHFIPLHQHMINRQLHSYKTNRCIRMQYERNNSTKRNSLAYYGSGYDDFAAHRNTQLISAHKNEVFILRQLRQVDRFDTERSMKQRTVMDYPLLFLSNAAESIKQQISNFFKRESEEDQVWMLSLDRMQNYKNYFPLDNPTNLQNKFRPSKNPRLNRLAPINKDIDYLPYSGINRRSLREGTKRTSYNSKGSYNEVYSNGIQAM